MLRTFLGFSAFLVHFKNVNLISIEYICMTRPQLVFNFRVYYGLIHLNVLMFQLFMSLLISIIKYMLFSF